MGTGREFRKFLKSTGENGDVGWRGSNRKNGIEPENELLYYQLSVTPPMVCFLREK